MLIAGVAGAAAMILPGVSGGYLLLVMGVYVPILAGIDAFKNGLKNQDWEVLTAVGLGVILPVGLGVVVGVVGVSNLLRWLLHRYERATLGVLTGSTDRRGRRAVAVCGDGGTAAGQIIKGQEVIFAMSAATEDRPLDAKRPGFTATAWNPSSRKTCGPPLSRPVSGMLPERSH